MLVLAGFACPAAGERALERAGERAVERGSERALERAGEHACLLVSAVLHF